MSTRRGERLRQVVCPCRYMALIDIQRTIPDVRYMYISMYDDRRLSDDWRHTAPRDKISFNVTDDIWQHSYCLSNDRPDRRPASIHAMPRYSCPSTTYDRTACKIRRSRNRPTDSTHERVSPDKYVAHARRSLSIYGGNGGGGLPCTTSTIMRAMRAAPTSQRQLRPAGQAIHARENGLDDALASGPTGP